MVFENTTNIVHRSTNDLILRLFSHLDRNWYPVNVKGTNVYEIISSYAEELSIIDNESLATLNDLDLNKVRSSLIYGTNYTHIYSNFGIIYETSKLSIQNYETYDTTAHVQSYRQELKFLSKAYVSGGTLEAVENLGYAFFNMKPHIIEPKLNPVGWQLKNKIGIVTAVSPNYILADGEFSGEILYMEDTSAFQVGDPCRLSYSKLGVTTKLTPKNLHYSGLIIMFHTSAAAAADTSLISALTTNLRRIIGANIEYRISFTDEFIIDVPD